MVLGEDGVAFGGGGGIFMGVEKIFAFNFTSSSTLWSYQAPTGNYVGIVASAAEGGLVAKVSAWDSSASTYNDTILRFDDEGNPTADSWSGHSLEYVFGSLWIGSTSTALNSLSAAISWGTSIWAMPSQRGTQQPTRRLDVRVARIADTDVSDAEIQDRIQQAIDFWQKKAQILLRWNGIIGSGTSNQDDPRCAADQPACSTGNLYDMIEVPQNATAIAELSRRYRYPATGQGKGLQLVFNYSNGGGTKFGITPTVLNGPSFNISAIGKDAQDLVAAHEIGHIFQLPHVLSPFNLMCGTVTLICPEFPSNGLSDDQIATARASALILGRP
jgi:hypothetical protein